GGSDRACPSGRLSVIVLEYPTQPLLASNASLDLLLWTRPRKQQLVRLTLVVPLAVIMFAEVFHGAVQRAFPKQNEMGKAFAFHRAHPSLREGVQIRTARRQYAGISHLRLPASFGNPRRTSHRSGAAHSDG